MADSAPPDGVVVLRVLAWDSVEMVLAAGDRIIRGAVEKRGDRVLVHHRGMVWSFDEGRQSRASSASSSSEIVAPMTGTVVQVFASDGQPVEAGAPLLVVEAMKMEHRILAPAKARVSRIHVKKGDRVDVGAPLVSLDRGDAK